MSELPSPLSPPPSPAALLPAGSLAAWLDQSTDLLALTDAAGAIRWCNPAFCRTTGLGAGDNLFRLAAADSGARAALARGLGGAPLADVDLALHSVRGAEIRVDAHLAVIGADRLWTLHDTTARHALAARAERLSELLAMAQDLGRLGIWERDFASGQATWDRHVFEVWGIEPSAGVPDYTELLARMHPDDRNDDYLRSTTRAGRYASRYRVRHDDGSQHWVHVQWEVKNSPQGVPDRAVGIAIDDTEVYELARSRDVAASQLRLATELADIVIWRHDLATDLIRYNDHGFKVLGVAPRPQGMSVAEARAPAHPDDVGKLAASTAHALATGVPIDVEVRHRRDDGVWRQLLVRRVIERDAAGAVIAFVGVTLDVTAQTEQSRRAEQLARRLDAAAEAAGIGIWTTLVGTRQTEWNAQMYELFDMVDLTEAPTLGAWLRRCVHPEDNARVTRTTRAFLTRRTRAFEIEFRSRRRDGRVRWMMLRADLDRSGVDPSRVFGIAMDVTERHATIDALHAANQRAALIAHHAGIGTWEIAANDQSAMWDEQMWRLRELEPQAGAPGREERLEMVHPDDRARVIDAHASLDDSPRQTAYEFRVRLPDGSYRWLASRSAALEDERGQVIRRVGVNWDITEAKNADLARQQALLAERESRAKSQFLARMSHELRTPLNAVLGFTQLLQMELADNQANRRGPAAQDHVLGDERADPHADPNADAQADDPADDQGDHRRRQPDHDPAASRSDGRSEKLGHIRSAGEHLLTLIDDALDLSRLQSGTLRLDLQAVPVAEAVAQAMPLVEALAQAQAVGLHRGPLDGHVLADPTRLRQVLLNLLSNAIKYNRRGGEVRVDSVIERAPAGAHPTGAARVRLRVRDTGRGLNPGQLAQLFEPFNRLGVEREGIRGSGIGLTIVKALVEGMGGAVEVSSEAGRGTLLEVTLPAAPVTLAAAAPATPADPADAPAGRTGQLLYIEDNSVNVLLVEELVKSLAGLKIVSESTGAAGIARAVALRPDLILVDMQLPDFDGFEVLRRLRAHPATATVRCIALSANAMPADIERALACGFQAYWTKPIRFKPFLEALDRLFPGSAAPSK